MLRHLTLTNFKTWARADLAFGQRITGLFGTNSSGKSSLLQFLLLLKQTKEAADSATVLEFNGPYVELGVYRDVIHDHEERLDLSWDLAFDLERALVLTSRERKQPLAQGDLVNIRGTVSQRESNLTSENLEYELGGVPFRLAFNETIHQGYGLTISQGTMIHRYDPSQIPSSNGPVKSYMFPDTVRTNYENPRYLSMLESSYDRQFNHISYLGPLREYPKRTYLWARSPKSAVGARGENAIEAILNATAAGETRHHGSRGNSMPFQEMIAFWLGKMGLTYDFKVVEIAPGSNIWQARVQVRKGGTEVLLTDVGFGVSQVLPVITLLQYVPEGSTVILEQPEIHLHPLAQANLAEMILDTARDRNLQVVVESHSEHLLLRMQRRVAEQKARADELKLYFCDTVGSESRLRPLRLDPLGRIGNWPRNFMGDAFGETYAAEKARLKREGAGTGG